LNVWILKVHFYFGCNSISTWFLTDKFITEEVYTSSCGINEASVDL